MSSSHLFGMWVLPESDEHSTSDLEVHSMRYRIALKCSCLAPRVHQSLGGICVLPDIDDQARQLC